MTSAETRNSINSANRSFKWTAIAEIAAKIMGPILNMVLARFISPAIFGIVATLSVITGLANTLSESGFARYVQQHQFNSEEEKRKSNKTSLTSSLAFGLLLFAAISLAAFPISEAIGARGYEISLIICAGAIPFHSLVAVETAVLKRDFKFKQTALIRVGSTFLTAIIQIVLAVLGYGLEALTWGPLVSSAVLAIILLCFLKDKRIIGWNPKYFKASFLDSFLFVIEGMCVWLASAFDILLLTNAFGETILGMYKLAFNTEKGIIALLGAVFSPVLISLLSQLSSEDQQFKASLIKYQKALAFLSLPLGLGVFVFQKGLTNIFLGDGWSAAIPVFGFFGLLDCLKCAISDFISTIMISKGKPLGSILSQIPYLIGVALCCAFANQLGFITFVALRASCTFLLIVPYLSLCKTFTGVSPVVFLRNLIKPAIAASLMCLLCLPFALISSSIVMTIFGVSFGALFYFVFSIVVFNENSNNFWSNIFPELQAKWKNAIVKSGLNKKPSFNATNLLIGLLTVTSAFAGSLTLSTSSTKLMTYANSFDICENAKRKSENGLTLIDYVVNEHSLEFNKETLKYLTLYGSQYTNFTDYFAHYMHESHHWGDGIEVELISFQSFWIPKRNISDTNYYRMEFSDLRFAWSSEESAGFNLPKIAISQKKADELLKTLGLESYEKLKGREISVSGRAFAVSNIVIGESWLYETFLDSFGDFAVCPLENLANAKSTLSGLYSNTPYALNRTLKNLPKNIAFNEDAPPRFGIYYFSDGQWLQDIDKSNKTTCLMKMIAKGTNFSMGGKFWAGLLLFVISALASCSLFALEKTRKKNVLFPITVGLLFIGMVSAFAKLALGNTYPFFAYYSIGLTIPFLFIAGILILIALFNWLKKGAKND